jgi:hypothetical protein
MGSESLTHAERAALGYGTATERLGKVRQSPYTPLPAALTAFVPQDSIKDYDACALCLHPCEVRGQGVLGRSRQT